METLPHTTEQATETPGRMLTPARLSERWDIPVATLAGWRYRGKGPAFLRLNGAVRYRLADVEAYEAAQLRGGIA